jgi:glycosyltransferase involved in cell wall biosynthesis
MTRELVMMGPFSPPQGGVAQFNDNLSRWLDLRGESHAILPYTEKARAGVQPYRLTFRGFFPHAIKLPYKSVCLDSAGFLLEYPSPGAIRAWKLARFVRRYYWIKVIHDGSFPARYSESSVRDQRRIRHLAKGPDEIIVVNDDLSHWLRSDLGVVQPVHTISSLLPPLPDDRAELARRHDDDVKGNKFKVICIGAFTPLYGFLHVAEAIDQLRNESGLSVSLLLVDAGFSGECSYRMKVLSGRPWISVRTSLLHAELMHTFSGCDVYVRACEHEGYGLSRVEALWCGLPVVATRSGEQRGMLLYDFGDVIGLKKSIAEAVSSPSQAEITYWGEILKSDAMRNLGKFQQLLAECRKRSR